MTPAPGDIDQVLIAPRYLAGGGDPAWITTALHRACGWSHGHDPLMPRVHLLSPDRQAMLRLDPSPDRQWWTLQHAPTATRPAWSATFGARTPVEIIAAFTDALTDPAAPASRTATPYRPLHAAGWEDADADHRDGLISPDGIAHVEHFTQGNSNSWYVDVAINDDSHGLLWKAHFSESTPPHLITAFTRALCDKEPLPRDALHMPALGRRHLRYTTRQVPAATAAVALDKRVRELAARSTPGSPPPQPPRVPPHRRSR
ncbi:DUF317 domain-containing protein [Streptomyces sp. UNOB3_S3]|uniref:DUF317 domain-containing protein n=1 Tax=Streptomyces sp. UNOB3_S3 TaxID=2871682 RepID=UPI001E48327C|nr:DUF317 domain-containing protein [Streptomyces sp. UNOB3_S3]MCC3778206.1 DUF317 domain-containing protein [Streptomyces sp. UNOB3_S3]